MVGQKSNQAFNFSKIVQNERLIVGLLLILGLAVRLVKLGTREIAYDDAFSYFLARQPLSTIVKGTVADTMPPLYYFVLHFFTKISHDLWVLRSLNVLLSIFTLYIIYLLAKELFQKEIGYLLLLFCAISPFLIYHAQELRMYTLLLLGQCGYLYMLIKICKHHPPRRRDILYAIIFASIAMYSHNLAVIGLLVCNLIIFAWSSWKSFRLQLFILIFTAILFLPWAWFLPQQISKVQTAFWTPRPGILEILQAGLMLFGFAPMPFIWMAIVLLALVQVFAIVSLWIFHQGNRLLFSLLAISFGLPGLLFAISYLTRPVFVPRIFILSTVIAYLLVSIFIYNNQKVFIGKFVFGLMMLVISISLPYHFSYQAFPRSAFRDAVELLETETLPSTMILHENKLSFFPMRFYGENLNQAYLADMPGSANDTLAPVSQIALGASAIDNVESIVLPADMYFVTFSQVEQEFAQAGVVFFNLEYLRQRFLGPESLIKIGDLNIYHFEKKP